VIAEPPVEAGAAKETVALALPETALTAVGAPGTVVVAVEDVAAAVLLEQPVSSVPSTM
jgi:hypothetical protein